MPEAVLYHIIPQKKLEEDYFNRLTFEIGKSERQRTLSQSKIKFAKRLFAELIKWIATCLLFARYFVGFEPKKGMKLILFRKNVTKGLLGKS